MTIASIDFGYSIIINYNKKYVINTIRRISIFSNNSA